MAESHQRMFTVRVNGTFRSAENFGRLALFRDEAGYIVRLRDVARIELGTTEDRTFFRGNGEAMVGLGIIKQSTANTIVMTGITTAAGAVPLIISFGAGAETRMVIGTVVLTGVLAAPFFTLLVVPVPIVSWPEGLLFRGL